uniref:Uncharacterized protein n=1 Tax=Megaviridae environmental sample TaxID=1737588 RepID=A0A5J6VLK8_9VIRU|nr:MAG: hypothetical protein [Megaviridae environmental sample]
MKYYHYNTHVYSDNPLDYYSVDPSTLHIKPKTSSTHSELNISKDIFTLENKDIVQHCGLSVEDGKLTLHIDHHTLQFRHKKLSIQKQNEVLFKKGLMDGKVNTTNKNHHLVTFDNGFTLNLNSENIIKINNETPDCNLCNKYCTFMNMIVTNSNGNPQFFNYYSIYKKYKLLVEKYLLYCNRLNCLKERYKKLVCCYSNVVNEVYNKGAPDTLNHVKLLFATQQLKKTPSTTQDADDYISNHLCNYNPTYQHNSSVDPTSLAVSSRPMSVFFYNNVAFLYTNCTISEHSTLSFTFNEDIDDYSNVNELNDGWEKDTLINYHLLLKRNTTTITKKKWKPLFSLKQEETKKRLVSVQYNDASHPGSSILIVPSGDVLSIEEICFREYNGFNPLQDNGTFDDYLTSIQKMIEQTRATAKMPSLIDTLSSISSVSNKILGNTESISDSCDKIEGNTLSISDSCNKIEGNTLSISGTCGLIKEDTSLILSTVTAISDACTSIEGQITTIDNTCDDIKTNTTTIDTKCDTIKTDTGNILLKADDILSKTDDIDDNCGLIKGETGQIVTTTNTIDGKIGIVTLTNSYGVTLGEQIYYIADTVTDIDDNNPPASPPE